MKTSLDKIIAKTFVGKKLTGIYGRNIEENYLRKISEAYVDMNHSGEPFLYIKLDNNYEYTCGQFTEIETL